jgi:hypothetical protein
MASPQTSSTRSTAALVFSSAKYCSRLNPAAAAASVVKAHGYKLESLQFNNAIFVRDDVANGVIQDRAVEEAYDAGYRNKAARKTLFPYNSNVDCALSYTAEENLLFFSELFKEYRGKFTLQ